jgi:hypothetical protein
MSVISTSRTGFLLTSIAAACVLTACGGNDNNSPASASNSGVVAAAGFMPGSTTGNPTLKAGYYAGATVCVDVNGNGCEFPAYRSHFVFGVMAPPDFRRNGATAFSA